jgi:formylmethanofuran dehydrogenase subunit B
VAGSADRAGQRDVACPFCGLGCDDLAIETAGERLTLREGACPISKAEFERPLPTASAARLAGKETDPAAAVAAAARLLTDSRLPLFGGLGTDVDGLRAVLDLADRCGGVIDHRHSAALFRDLPTLREIGTMTTTLSEVRNRADLLLIVGPDPRLALPRFFERCLGAGELLFGERKRRVIRLGPAATAAMLPSVGDERAGIEITEIPCPLDELPAAAAALRALANGRKPAMPQPAALGEALRGASYAVVAWCAGLLDFAGADLLVLALTELVRDLNRKGRAAALPLGGAGNLVGANQVALWQSGFPLRTSFAGGTPRHDPHRHAAERLIGSGEADLLIWIAALDAGPPPPLPPELPTILLAPPGATSSSEPAVFLPVGRPGIDHAGQVFRTDGTVALPLSRLRSSALPSVGATLRAIAQSLPDSPAMGKS